jgi:hypothetical protein
MCNAFSGQTGGVCHSSRTPIPANMPVATARARVSSARLADMPAQIVTMSAGSARFAAAEVAPISIPAVTAIAIFICFLSPVW